MTTFSDLGISEPVVRAMNKMGWTEPTPVQVASIPYGLTGKDLFAQAQTGTGKTGAYTSIILGRIEAGFKDPSALVLTPTRELAIQVADEMGKLSQFTNQVCTVIYGGVSMTPQITKLRKGTDIVVGTPGRIRDLIDQKCLDLSWISAVVLDEADRMLDMGFARDLDYILSKVPKKRQMLMFSATMTPDINKLAKAHMTDAKEFLVSKDEPVLDLIKQYYVIADKDSKRDYLREILDNGNPRTIVFCHTKRKAGQIAKKMINEGYVAAALHGDVPQAKREKIITSFKNGSIDLLIATDVAARGLDIDDVEYVINYDMPDVAETYVHRIGRVGRAGRTGIAVSFVLNEEKRMIKDIERLTGKRIDLLTPNVLPHASPKADRPEKVIVREPVKEQTKREPAKKEPVTKQKREQTVTRSQAGSTQESYSIQIFMGSTQGLTKADVGALFSDAGLVSKDVGAIVLGKKATFVEVRCHDIKALVSELNSMSYNGSEVRVRSI